MKSPLRICGTLTCMAVLLLGHASAVAGKGSQLIKSHYGPAVDGLRLAVEVGSPGTKALFHVRNVGAKPVRFAERFSCSGYSSWWLTGGADKAKLTTNYAYEPRRKGLTTKRLMTVCTRNGPTNYRTVKPGQVATVSVPFANNESLTKGRDMFFRAHALLTIKGRHGILRLATPVTRRQKP